MKILLPFLLILAGCDHSYWDERELWKADQVKLRIMQSRDEIHAGDFKNLQERYQRLIREAKNPETAAGALMGLAKLEEIKGNHKEAGRLYNKALTDYFGTQTALSIPFALTTMGNPPSPLYDQAVDYYRRIREEFPNSPLELKALEFEALSHLRQGNTDAAAQAYERIASRYWWTKEGRNAKKATERLSPS